MKGLDLKTTREIVGKLKSGKFGLLSLAKEYNISPKIIIELPRLIEKEEEKEKAMKKTTIQQNKGLLIGKINYYLALLEETINSEDVDYANKFFEYCHQYIEALRELKKEIRECKSKEEFYILKDLANLYFSGIKVRNGEIVDLEHPDEKLLEWLHS
jgi:vacuolar-type H+-ATPase subunit E/Vma4